MTTTTTSNVVLKLPNLSHNTVSVSVSVSVGFLCPKPLHLSSLHSNFRTKLKLPSFSISRPTHFKVSQNSITTTEESLSNDLLIVGPGVLGRLVAQKWRHEIPGCEVYGQTMTTDHHNELIQMGINPSLKWTEATHKFPNVLYCAPPSRTKDYADNVRLAALSWNGGGSFIFTSSSAPYDCNDNGPCDEDTPSVPIGRSPRVDILLNAENVVLEFGGCVLRLAGGAHNYYLEKGIVDSRPDHILNLIHYEDAASLLVAILKKKIRKQIFLGCDNHPLSRQEMMDLVNRSGKFSKKFDKFNVTDGPLGKRLNNTRTRQEVGWEPQYPSFAHFLASM
ncbi:NAD(P)-binding rossmann-fold protein, putative [Medicago truncatula]|uniref:NAD(P)-binding rossmann-fold protein, putative n=1 Tax=Medicago truncatula TaxID=3880 RepID=A0A072UNP0_MEDTR|nr:NAD(P)-binding rossmann-fold protein, putative [Medicago truncatula]